MIAKKYLTQKETAFLRSLSRAVARKLEGLTFRETKAVGLGSAQFFALRKGETVNFTAVTLLRIADFSGMTMHVLLKEAEAPTTCSLRNRT